LAPVPLSGVVQEAREIYEKYVEEGAPLQVNLSYDCVETIRHALDALHSFNTDSAPASPSTHNSVLNTEYTFLAPLDGSLAGAKPSESLGDFSPVSSREV